MAKEKIQNNSDLFSKKNSICVHQVEWNLIESSDGHNPQDSEWNIFQFGSLCADKQDYPDGNPAGMLPDDLADLSSSST